MKGYNPINNKPSSKITILMGSINHPQMAGLPHIHSPFNVLRFSGIGGHMGSIPACRRANRPRRVRSSVILTAKEHRNHKGTYTALHVNMYHIYHVSISVQWRSSLKSTFCKEQTEKQWDCPLSCCFTQWYMLLPFGVSITGLSSLSRGSIRCISRCQAG